MTPEEFILVFDTCEDVMMEAGGENDTGGRDMTS